MTSFIERERSVATSMEHRLALMQQPSDFFAQFFGGRVPSVPEVAYHVEQMVQRMTSTRIYENDTYHVELRYQPPFVHLDITRHDRGSCKNWRELQQIKNEIVGSENEAVELFPAESRLVDTANQYHLWVHLNPEFRFPFGFKERCVLNKPVTYLRYVPADSPALKGRAARLTYDQA
jgi:hypothetical protein